MRTYTETITGDAVSINVPENDRDRQEFLDWIDQVTYEGQKVAVDVEATGINQRAPEWRLRMVQFGTRGTAWVLIESKEAYSVIASALLHLHNTVAHNRPYDALALEVSGYRHNLWDGADTMTMSHLVDSRSLRDGGVGHGLKALATHYVDAEAADSDKALKEWAKANKVKMGDRFAAAPDTELERYAGMDVILTRRLYDTLEVVLEQAGDQLLPFELAIQRTCNQMSNRGILLDIPYTHALDDYFLKSTNELVAQIQDHGIENPNSSKQIIDALSPHVELTVMTPSGKPSVAKDVLAAVDHPLAQLITEYRHASKFRTTYVTSALNLEHQGRIHPDIRSLQARTARMSISNPPLQQLPSSDALVRRMFIADPGHVIGAADFSQVELRVLAALAQERNMLQAIADGIDLHTNTAEAVGIDRKIAKMTNFLTVYGGGKTALSQQAGISIGEADLALRGFKSAFPRITTYGNRLQERSDYGRKPVVTPSGRRLKLDRDRTYAAINYVVQSAARDVLVNAMTAVEESRHGAGMLLPVHDEIVFQTPEDGADEAASEIARLMEMDFLGVFLACDGEIFGPSWGHGYLDVGTIPPELSDWF